MKAISFESGLRGQDYNEELEDEISSQIKSTASHSLGRYNKRISRLKVSINAWTKKINTPLNDLIKEQVAYLKPILDKALTAIVKKYGEMHELLKVKKDERIQASTRLHSMTEEMSKTKGANAIPSSPTPLDSVKAMIGAILGTSTVDTIINLLAIDKYGESSTMTTGMICAGISLCVGLACHLFGSSISKKNYLEASMGLIAGILATIFMITLRDNAPEPSSIPSFILTLANISTLFFGLILAVRVNKYRPYFKLKNLIATLTTDIKNLKQNLILKGRELKDTENYYTAIAYQTVYQKREQDKAHLLALQTDCSETEEDLNTLQNTIEEWTKESVASIRTSYQKGLDQNASLDPLN